MSPKLEAVTYAVAQRQYRDLRLSNTDLFITPEAIEVLEQTVAVFPPETGAIGLGPKDQGGVDVTEFDEQGSSRASGVAYAPDRAWCDARLEFWSTQGNDKLHVLHAGIHSHPGDYGHPSSDSGPGLGDVAYAEAVLSAQRWMRELFIPIITGCGTAHPRLWSYVVAREHFGEARFAEVHICEVSEFPPRRFDPTWEATLAQTASLPEEKNVDLNEVAPALPFMALDVAEIATRSATTVRANCRGYVFSRAGVDVEVVFPDSFPRTPPVLGILNGGIILREFVPRWPASHKLRAELRVARVIKRTIAYETAQQRTARTLTRLSKEF